jgi:hypothetical protein
VTARIDQWEALDRISPKTAERYRELHANQITPFIGSTISQQLKSADVERWHATLKTSGRKDGTGGLSMLTIRHAPIACYPRRLRKPRAMTLSCAMSPATRRRRGRSGKKLLS